MSALPDVVVVGAGCAGLSAAARLAGAGARVVVVEARARLGGRATSFVDRQSGEVVDNGQHVLLGCYRATFAFLREIGAEQNVRLDPQLAATMIDREGYRSRLACPPLPPPLHLVAGVMRWGALSWSDRLSVLRMAGPIRRTQREIEARSPAAPSLSTATVEQWLIRYGQTARIRELLWDPLALAALNQAPADAAAAPFARVLAEMFGGDARAASIALPVKPLHEAYAEPARAFIESRGGEVITGATARVLVDAAAIAAVEAGDRRWKPRAVVSAVPWFAFSALAADAPALAAIAAHARTMAASPILTVNLWYDRQVVEEPFVGLPGRAMQWVFDKARLFGGSASHLSLVASGANPVLTMANEEVIALASREVADALPRARTARLIRGAVIREPHATFSLAPGQPPRPATCTPVGGLFLAGDWIDTGLPATIESAVRSGHAAADAVLAQ